MKRDNYKQWLHIWAGEVFGDYKDSIIQPEWVKASIDAHLKLGFKAVGVKSLGFDPADTGGDAKAICLRHGSVITAGEQWLDGELPGAIDKAFTVAYDERADFIVYDSDGLGRAVKVGLDARLEGKHLAVHPYGGNDKKDNEHELYDHKTNKDKFKNKRAQYWWYLRDRFEATYNAIEHGVYTDPEKLISLSSDIEDLDQLRAELSKPQRKRGSNSFIQIESKEDMRKREVKSPNMADALVMCFANPPPSVTFKPIKFASLY
jgi:phage terminase large subunit